MLSKLGHSTKGWSHVGQQLGNSLSNELDVVMGTVTTHLTDVITDMTQVKSGIDTALSMIGTSTDASLAKVGDKTAFVAFHGMVIAAASKPGWSGPKAKPSLLASQASGRLSPEAENEVVWMMETSRVNSARRSKTPITAGWPGYAKPPGSQPGQATWKSFTDSSVNGIVSAVMDGLKKPQADENAVWPSNEPTVFQNIKYPVTNTADYQTNVAILEWCLNNTGEVEPALNAFIGNHYDEANKIWHDARMDATEWAVVHVDQVTSQLMVAVNEKINSLLAKLKPALLQIGKWLKSFGTKVQTTIEGFSTTLDKVQKIFDKLMKQMTHSKGADTMIEETYNLFDASNTGSISAADLKEVGEAYGITALTGEKGKGLLKKYDADNNQNLDKGEFALFVQDASIPGAMAVVLRAYAKKLAQISGNVAAARKRDEVARAVVDYLELVCIKNATKVGWVSQALTNGSLPLDFTADLLKNMAMDVDNPARVFSTEPGPILVSKMVELNHQYVIQALTRMSDPHFWADEGYDVKDQPTAIERITKWVTDASRKTSGRAHTQLYQLFGGHEGRTFAQDGGYATLSESILEAMPSMAAEFVSAKSHRYMAEQRVHRAQAHAKLFSSHSAKLLFNELYGGATAGSTIEDPEAAAAVKSGVPAHPETLKFAQYLAANSTETAKRLQDRCFEYMGDSSSTLDSFATQIQAMIKKTQNFLNTMMQYSTPSGIEQLENQMKQFVDNSESKVKMVIKDKVYKAQNYTNSHFDLPHALSLPHNTLKDGEVSAAGGNVFMTVKKVLDQLAAVLPEVINDIKFAKTEVSAVSKQLHSIFNTFEVKGPPVFFDISKLYETLWIAYFVFFTILTVGILAYGFWASGWLSASTPAGEDSYQPPTGFLGRCQMCCRACTTCMSSCQDNTMCFWSCIILFEIIVLVIFIVAIVLTILSGIKAFMGASCASIYFLGDPKICYGILGMVKGWLTTFWADGVTSITDVCEQEQLLTCTLIEEKLMKSVLYTTMGSMVAAILSFQMIVNTAQLHEQARWIRVVDTLTNGKDV